MRKTLNVKKKLSKRNIDVLSLEKSFAQTTNSQIKDLKINMEEFQKSQNEITINGNTAIMELMQRRARVGEKEDRNFQVV